MTRGTLFRNVRLILLWMPLATILFMYLDISPLMASHRIDHVKNIALDRPMDFMAEMQIYVVSLPDRQSRRMGMKILLATLGLHFVYFDAMPADNPLVGQILDWVKKIRSSKGFRDSADTATLSDDAHTLFSWPEHIEDIANFNQEIPLLSSDVWELPTSPPPYQPLTCNKRNYDMPDFSPGSIPEHMRLTPARVACWHSHLSVIHQHANAALSGADSVALILEDDIDMEKDIVDQMKSLWSDLPADWDMVFLGHCWSDEARGPLLVQNTSGVANTTSYGSRIHLSTSPKCTHAYAISHIGARRLLLYLTYPPFAYSRAIDQAFAWLVKSGRIKSFSIVPNLAIQRKIAVSDVKEGGVVNSKWKAALVDGVFSTTALSQ